MKLSRHFRAYFVLAVLFGAGVILLLREHRPSFLRPGLRLNAYVSTADGSVTVVDLVKLADLQNDLRKLFGVLGVAAVAGVLIMLLTHAAQKKG